MIIVIADDFSGAAEIAGIGFRYGLKAVIRTDVELDLESDILIIDSNTRSLTEDESLKQIIQIADQLKEKSWEWIYKKTDSVLRGHVLSELTLLVKKFSKDKALLLPQNPVSGRIIKDGIYYINKTPLHLSGFAADPDYPRTTSDVLSLLGQSEDILDLRVIPYSPKGASTSHLAALPHFWLIRHEKSCRHLVSRAI